MARLLNWLLRSTSSRIATYGFVSLLTLVGIFASMRHRITLDREILIKQSHWDPTGIIRTSDGSLIVLGAGDTAHAVALTSEGKLKWSFAEPINEGIPAQGGGSSVSFNSAVAIDHGNVLLCGKKLLPTQDEIGFIVILNSEGKPLDERTMAGAEGVPFSIERCLPWGVGVAVIESARGSGSALLRLNASGNQVGARFDVDISGDVVETADHSLVSVIQKGVPQLTRIDSEGHQAERRVFPAAAVHLMRTISLSNTAAVVVQSVDGSTLITVDAALDDVSTHKARAFIDVTGGYRRKDGSIFFFGREGVRAGMKLVSGRGRIATVTSYPQFSSVEVTDAIPISDDQFVTVRDQDAMVDMDRTDRTVHLERNGVVVTWMTVK